MISNLQQLKVIMFLYGVWLWGVWIRTMVCILFCGICIGLFMVVVLRLPWYRIFIIIVACSLWIAADYWSLLAIAKPFAMCCWTSFRSWKRWVLCQFLPLIIIEINCFNKIKVLLMSILLYLFGLAPLLIFRLLSITLGEKTRAEMDVANYVRRWNLDQTDAVVCRRWRWGSGYELQWKNVDLLCNIFQYWLIWVIVGVQGPVGESLL